MDLLGHIHDEQMGNMTNVEQDIDLLSNIEDVAAGAPGTGAQEDVITPTMLRGLIAAQTNILADQTKALLGDLRGHLTELQSEIKTLGASQTQLKWEIRTLGIHQTDLQRKIQTLEKSCVAQIHDLQQGVQSTEETIEEVKLAQGDFEKRLQALEAWGSEGSAATTVSQARRRTSLVLGGWGPDTAASEMLEHAQRLIRDLRLDIDTDNMLVPGVRKGLVIIPYQPRDGESWEGIN